MASLFPYTSFLILTHLLSYITPSLPAPSCCKDLVLLISFDGFRYDYLDRVKQKGLATPNFDMLINDGVKAEYMKNVFITKTFPNHYTLVTGMYEDSHGVISNNMVDSRFPKDKEFTPAISNIPGPELDKWFNNYTTGSTLGPEPIWVTNQKGEQKDKGRKSGVAMWPGMLAEIHGYVPEKMLPFDKTTSNETKIDTVVKWFSSEDPINLGLLYFNEPDHTGHLFGPDSEQIEELIVALDKLVGYLIDELKKHDLFERMNLIITSDHGMQQITNVTFLDDQVEPDEYEAFGSTPVLNVRATRGESKSVKYRF